MDKSRGFLLRHKVITGLLVMAILASGSLGCQLRGPYRSYKLDFVKPEPSDALDPGVLEVGVAKRDITPDLEQYDTWNDVDGNNLYEKQKGDTYNDVNKNGKFDGVWMAGFNHNRPAKGIHDRLWTRAIAFRNNGVTVVMVTVDSIGIFIEEFIRVRESLDPSLGIDHVMFSSLHIHEVPDTMGLWSYPVPFFCKDKAYMKRVNEANREAIEEAVRHLEPADMICAQTLLHPDGFVRDSRPPIVIDQRLSCLRLMKHGTDETIATVVCWGNHPETLDSRNPLLTADFCHYLREGLENGVPDPKGCEGFGGMCLYFQGLIGGLMTQLHMGVPDRNTQEILEAPTFEKAQALGENLAIECASLLRSEKAWPNETPAVAVAAKTIYAPMSGMLGWAITLGLAHPGWYWGKARSEVNVIRIGEVEILTAPGELYPEIAVGGIEAKEGRDFAIDPVEVPPLYEQMDGRMNFMIGLANDEIGYMLPKSQWDAKPPHVYGKRPYGEENSGGPEIGPTYHREASALLQRMHEVF